MWRFVSQPVVLLGLLLASIAGCGGSGRQWEVSVRNDSGVPASFFVTFDGGTTFAGGTSQADVANVAKGPPISAIVGNANTIVQTVRVVRGKDEQTLNPNMPLAAGNRCLIIVDADGKIDLSFAD